MTPRQVRVKSTPSPALGSPAFFFSSLKRNVVWRWLDGSGGWSSIQSFTLTAVVVARAEENIGSESGGALLAIVKTRHCRWRIQRKR